MDPLKATRVNRNSPLSYRPELGKQLRSTQPLKGSVRTRAVLLPELSLRIVAASSRDAAQQAEGSPSKGLSDGYSQGISVSVGSCPHTGRRRQRLNRPPGHLPLHRRPPKPACSLKGIQGGRSGPSNRTAPARDASRQARCRQTRPPSTRPCALRTTLSRNASAAWPPRSFRACRWIAAVSTGSRDDAGAFSGKLRFPQPHRACAFPAPERRLAERTITDGKLTGSVCGKSRL